MRGNANGPAYRRFCTWLPIEGASGAARVALFVFTLAWIGCGAQGQLGESETGVSAGGFTEKSQGQVGEGAFVAKIMEKVDSKAYQAVVEATSADELLAMVSGNKFACLELVGIGSIAKSDILQRLGDVAQADQWSRMVPLLNLSTNAVDAENVIAFVRRGSGSAARLEGRNRQGLPNLTHDAIVAALDTVGRIAANLDAEGVEPHTNTASTFLLQCASPKFWASSQIAYLVPDEWQRLRFGLRCIVSLAYSDSASIGGMLAIRFNQIQADGDWHRRLSVAQGEYGRIRSKIAQNGGFASFVLATHSTCRP